SPPTSPRRRGRLQPELQAAASHRGRPHSRKRRSIFCALSKGWAASSTVGSTNAKNDGCSQLIAGIGFLRLPASSTSAQGILTYVRKPGGPSRLPLRGAVTRCRKSPH